LAKPEYRFFTRDTIKPAIAEVCFITDIEIELVEYKDGKSIADVQFYVRHKAQTPLPLKNPPKPVDLSIIKKAYDLGINEDRAEELIAKHGEEDMKQGLIELQSRMASAFPSPVRDPFRYLKATLAGVQQKLVEIPVDPVESAQTVEFESSKKKVEVKAAWRDEWLRRQKERVVALLQELSQEGVKELELDLARELEFKQSHPSVIKRLQSNGWFHPMVRHLMIDFYAKAVLSDDWDKPSSEALLDIASETKS
jgi:hypothetical protein